MNRPWRPFARIDTVALPAAALTVAAGVWWAVTAFTDTPRFLLPAPLDVLDAYRQHGAYLLREARATVGHTLGGFAVAVCAGTLMGILLGASATVRKTLMPLVLLMQAVPKVAIAPLLIVWLGFGPSSKITLVALLCFFPVIVATVAGLTSTPAEAVELARSLSASRWKTMYKIRLPHALPSMFTGAKIAVSLAVIGAVVAEITSPNAGLGAVVMRASQAANTATAFAAIGLLAAFFIGLYYSIVAMQRLLLPWAAHTTQ